MKDKELLVKVINDNYEKNVKFLDEQFKNENNENIITILLDNINTIENENTFTQKDLLICLAGIALNLSHVMNDSEQVITYFKATNYTWIEEIRDSKLKVLDNENN